MLVGGGNEMLVLNTAENNREKAKMSMHLKIHPLFKIIIPIVLWIHACSSDPKLSDTMIQIKAAKDKVLTGYDKEVRPTTKESNTTVVIINFIPRQILDVNEEKGLFELDSYLYMGWEDPRLTWEKSKDTLFLQLPPELLWLPDVSIYNSHSNPVDPKQNVILSYVENNGFVTWIPPIHTSTSCPSLLQVAYPGDIVRCGVKMGSWMHGGWEVDLYHMHEIWMHDFLNIHSRWELLVSEVTVVRNTTDYYEGYNDTFLFNEVIFPLKRRPSPEIEVTRSPCILVMLITLAMFWMPPDSSGKLMMGGISLLALIILVIYVVCSTKFPLKVLFAISFLQSTMYIVVVSNLLQVLVIFNLCNITGPARPPAAIMQLLSGPFGKYTCLRSSPSTDNIPVDRLQPKDNSQNLIKQSTPNEDWILFASGLDRLFFVMMTVSMVAIHHVK